MVRTRAPTERDFPSRATAAPSRRQSSSAPTPREHHGRLPPSAPPGRYLRTQCRFLSSLGMTGLGSSGNSGNAAWRAQDFEYANHANLLPTALQASTASAALALRSADEEGTTDLLFLTSFSFPNPSPPARVGHRIDAPARSPTSRHVSRTPASSPPRARALRRAACGAARDTCR